MNNLTTITTAIIYTFYTTQLPHKETYTVGTETIATEGDVTFKDKGMFTFTFTHTMDSEEIASSESALQKALSIATSVSEASISSEEAAKNRTMQYSATAAGSDSSDSSATATSSSSSEEASSSSTASTTHSANAAIPKLDKGLFGSAGVAGVAALVACLL